MAVSTYAGLYQSTLHLPSGAAYLRQQVEVRTTGGAVAALWMDKNRAVPTVNPVQVDTSGDLAFYADPGEYDLILRGVPVRIAVPPHPDEIIAKVGKGDLMASVLDHGAVGDGTTLDHAAINAAIAANPGKTVYLPKTASGVYLIDAAANVGYQSKPVGIKLDQPGTRLVLERGVTLRVKPTASTEYAAIQVTAADCSIEGGAVVGDVDTHLGSTGEWGMCVYLAAGADRCRVQGVYVAKAWGDGVYIAGAPADVSIVDVVADNCRRQGMSITDAVRPRVIGGAYINTGRIAFTGPGSGIDIEPGGSQNVVDALLSGVLLYNNKGGGLISAQNGASISATVVGCRAVANGDSGQAKNGFNVSGPGNSTSLLSCEAVGNGQDGFFVLGDTTQGVLSNCVAKSNIRFGMTIVGDGTKVTGPIVKDNGRTGIYIDATADSTTITGGETYGNSTATNAGYPNIDINGTNTRISGHVADAGAAANKPSYGYLIHAAATGTHLLGCDTRGSHATAEVLDSSAVALMRPTPGATAGSVTQTFAASGTWTKLAGAKSVVVTLVAGGPGGGSGRRGAPGSIRTGGGGGGGGALSTMTFQAADLASTVAVTIGAGGAGGAAQTVNDTNGNAGASGGITSFGAHLSARGGAGGGAGSTSAGSAGAGGLGHVPGVPGGASSATGGVGAGGGATAGAGAAGGAGAGGGITSGDVAAAGGAGSACFTCPGALGGSAGAVDSTTPTQGTPGSPASVPAPGPGGGAASITTAAQAGANGLQPGGPGGGGGASLNGNNSGAGGTGGAGYATVTTYLD